MSGEETIKHTSELPASLPPPSECGAHARSIAEAYRCAAHGHDLASARAVLEGARALGWLGYPDAGLDLLQGLLEPTRWPAAARAEARLERADLLLWLGRCRAAIQELDGKLGNVAPARASLTRAQAQAFLGQSGAARAALLNLRDFDPMLRPRAALVALRLGDLRNARDHADRAGGDGAEEAEAQRVLGIVAMLEDRPAEARRHLERALELLHALDRPALLARAHVTMARACLEEGASDLGELYLRRAAAFSERSSDPALQALVAGQMGALALERGQIEEAVASFELDLSLCRRADTDFRHAHALGAIGRARLLEGRTPESIAALTTAAELHAASDHTVASCVIAFDRALAEARTDVPLEDCQRRIADARDRLAGLGCARLLPLADLADAMLRARSADVAGAELSFAVGRDALSGRGAGTAPGSLVAAYLAFAEALHAAGQDELGIDYLREGYTIASTSRQAELGRRLLARIEALDARQEVVAALPPALQQGGRLGGTASFESLIGTSAPMAALREMARRAAELDVNVLILGESGTGKELVATAIHAGSRRSGRPAIVVNCAALPETLIESELFGHVRGAFSGASAERVGAFERAHESTLVLDEVGELSLSVQAKLLRALEQGEVQRVGGPRPLRVDVRVIAATNRPLARGVEAGEFRADLYHRLAKIVVETVPLRAHTEDLRELVAHLLGTRPVFAERGLREVSRAALDALAAYPFPGNVRELENVLIAGALRAEGELVQLPHLPGRVTGWVEEPMQPVPAPALSPQPSPPPPRLADTLLVDGFNLDALERDLVGAALGRAKGNKAAAARLLGITRRRLYSRLKHLEGDDSSD